MNHKTLLAAAGLMLGLAGAATAQDGMATAALKTADGADAGTVTFQEMPAGVLVKADLTGLPPGAHGFHIHQTGACTPDFKAAGEHLAPDGHEHGFGATAEPHAGDLPNIVAGDDGAASAEFLDWRLKFTDLMDDDGSAIMVHADPDDYMDKSSAGDRFACGVIDPQG